MMKVKSPGLQFYVDKLRNNEPFSFVRYGDGEFDCILKLGRTMGARNQHCLPDLVLALKESLTEKRAGAYYHAMNPDFMGRISALPKIEAWLASNAPTLDWHQCTIFYKASLKGRLFPLVQAMEERRVVVVGPPWLNKLPFASEFVPVRTHDCWKDVNSIVAQLRNLKNAVVSFSAGPTTKVLIHRLQPLIGKHSWLIDCGSVWDIYCGVKSRSYHGRVTPAIQRKNLTGK